MGLELKGVNQGPFGSESRKKEIDNSNPDKLFSPKGLEVLREILTEYCEAGATIGGAPTFRLTDFRASEDKDWKYDPDAEELQLEEITKLRNEQAVQIAREVYGSRIPIVGLLAPVSDTSGDDDEKWAALGDNQIEWAMRRQLPQMKVLNDAGVNALWFEAIRYVNEAKAIAKAAKHLGVKTLVINFEADKNGIPDPAHKGKTFIETKEELQRLAGDDIEILIGANCTGISNIQAIWDRGDRVDVAYPNELDLSPETKSKLSELYETGGDPGEIERIKNDNRTEFENVVQFWKDAIDKYGVKIIGSCCGTTPQHTEVARLLYDKATQ